MWRNFSRDNKLSTEGTDLIKLRHDVLQLMTMLYHKYLSIRLINGNGIPNNDPFRDDGSKSSDVLSLRSTDNEDDSTWNPEDDECQQQYRPQLIWRWQCQQWRKSRLKWMWVPSWCWQNWSCKDKTTIWYKRHCCVEINKWFPMSRWFGGIPTKWSHG